MSGKSETHYEGWNTHHTEVVGEKNSPKRTSGEVT